MVRTAQQTPGGPSSMMLRIYTAVYGVERSSRLGHHYGWTLTDTPEVSGGGL